MKDQVTAAFATAAEAKAAPYVCGLKKMSCANSRGRTGEGFNASREQSVALGMPTAGHMAAVGIGRFGDGEHRLREY